MAPPADEREHDLLAAESDGELLGRIAERDIEAFEVLYQRYVRPVYELALSQSRDRDRAEDATQRAFAAIWRSAPTYCRDRGSAARWLFTVAQNAIVDDARTPSPTPHDPGPEPVAEDGWLAFRVQAVVAELPEQERVLLELAYWEGRNQREIAEVLGLPPGSVEARARGALARLGVQLEGLPLSG